MKLHVNIGQTDLGGYVNLDLTKHQVDFNNMDTICEAAECTEIFLNHILSCVSLQQVLPLLQKFVSRLRKNGVIIINDFDLNSATTAYINGTLSLTDINNILFNTNANIKRASCISCSDVKNMLIQCNIKVSSIELNNVVFIITGKRAP